MRIFLMLAALSACALYGPAMAQNPGEYAAVAANNEGNLQVRWGKTSQEAKQSAAEACTKVSKTCASDPASTNILDDYFAWICCYRPNFSCASPSHETRDKATEAATQMMSERGYSDCSVRSFFSARTGKQQ